METDLNKNYEDAYYIGRDVSLAIHITRNIRRTTKNLAGSTPDMRHLVKRRSFMIIPSFAMIFALHTRGQIITS